MHAPPLWGRPGLYASCRCMWLFWMSASGGVLLGGFGIRGGFGGMIVAFAVLVAGVPLSANRGCCLAS
jgi:hypothetical protein